MDSSSTSRLRRTSSRTHQAKPGVEKVVVANKHPGVFMETEEMVKETGEKDLPVGIVKDEVPAKKRQKSEQETDHVHVTTKSAKSSRSSR